MSNQPTHLGGHGRPLLLVHGLMGRGTTWTRQLDWLTEFGAVYGYDAPWHRGRDAARPARISTEVFVDELGAAARSLGGPVVLIGHSMGSLHSWCLAAEDPDLVAGILVEDMAPDFVGRTTGPWEPWVHALPVEFESEAAVVAEFGPVAGRYFLEAFDRTDTGWRLHDYPQNWLDIAAEWGTRDYWGQWSAVRAPALLLEAGNSVAPPGQMAKMAEIAEGQRRRVRYLRVPDAGHLIHDDAPQIYRREVSDFLRAL
ncbi:MAG: alpha/beta hydrolase [Mycolicibacterium sp.]|nr:alpha/beta hydrolase [Mycolicibacterium sp.]